MTVDVEEARQRRRRPPPPPAAALVVVAVEPKAIVAEKYNNTKQKHQHYDHHHHHHHQQQQQQRRKRKNRRFEPEEPFYVLFVKVAIVLFLLSSTSLYLWRTFMIQKGVDDATTTATTTYNAIGDDDDATATTTANNNNNNNNNYHNNVAEEKEKDAEEVKGMLLPTLPTPTQAPTVPTIPPLPVWKLGNVSTYDAYGIAHLFYQQQQQTIMNHYNVSTTTTTTSTTTTTTTTTTTATATATTIEDEFWNVARTTRNKFAQLYGGENAGRAMLERGMTGFPNTTTTASTSTSTNTSTNTQKSLPSDLVATACRIQRARDQQRPFTFAFGGYSVTVGRGNYFYQSFPFCMERILRPLFTSINMTLQVRNAAIGGCPSFPYGFCQTNHWGKNVDVVSWDFSMNEPNGIAQGLEAYLRHATTLSNQYHHHHHHHQNHYHFHPKLIVKDTFDMGEKRRSMLHTYAKWGVLPDPIVLHSDPAVRPFLELQHQYRQLRQQQQQQHRDEEGEEEETEDWIPPGFRQWRKFGSPPGAPGQALHHPAVKEHELLGWMVAMHFLSAMELLVAAETITTTTANNNHHHHHHHHHHHRSVLQFTCPSTTADALAPPTSADRLLPPPLSINATTADKWSSIFFGVPIDESTKTTGTIESNSSHNDDNNNNNNNDNNNHLQHQQSWKMNPVYCKTTYEPIVNSSRSGMSHSLTSIVVDGTIGEDMDIMLPKGHMFYNQAWVLDLSEGEKEAKRKLDRFGGLGFIDSKKAYRGLFTSGTLRFFLPFYYNDDDKNKNNNNNNKSNNKDVKSNSSSITKHLQQQQVEYPKIGDLATDWFQSIVVCEVNERREPSACQTGNDVTFRVGKINATDVTMLSNPGTLYLGKKICTYIDIPKDATLTSRQSMLLEEDPTATRKTKTLFDEKRIRASAATAAAAHTAQFVGLSLELTVHNHLIIARDKACSVSHVIWEQRTPQGVRLPVVHIPKKEKL